MCKCSLRRNQRLIHQVEKCTIRFCPGKTEMGMSPSPVRIGLVNASVPINTWFFIPSNVGPIWRSIPWVFALKTDVSDVWSKPFTLLGEVGSFCLFFFFFFFSDWHCAGAKD